MTKDKPSIATIGMQAVIGAIVGFGVTYTVLRVADPAIDVLSGIELIGLVVSLILMLSGGYMMIAASNPATYAKLAVDDPDAEPADHDMVAMARMQGFTNLTAGVLLAIPPIANAVGIAETTRLPLYLAIVGLLAVQSWINMRIWQKGDELLRSVVILSGALSFWSLQGLLFLWAAAEKLGLAPPLDSWTILIVVMIAYLAAGTFVSIKRGLAIN